MIGKGSLPTGTAEIKTGIAEKSSPGTRQTDGKNLVWFGEIERNLAKLSMPIPLLAVLPLNYFVVLAVYKRSLFSYYHNSLLMTSPCLSPVLIQFKVCEIKAQQ